MILDGRACVVASLPDNSHDDCLPVRDCGGAAAAPVRRGSGAG
jgi:hypothetical protein